jgi:hypothetical protein
VNRVTEHPLIRPNALTTLNQLYRVPGVVPLGVPATSPGRSPDKKLGFPVADELIRVIGFAPAQPDGRPYSHQYLVRAAGVLAEPSFSNGDGGSTDLFVQNLEDAFDGDTGVVGSFKKISALVEIDPSMVDPLGGDDDLLSVQVKFAGIALIRSLSRAMLQSNGMPSKPRGKGSPVTSPGDGAADLRGLPSFVEGTAQDCPWDPNTGLLGGLAVLEAICQPSGGDFGARPDAFVMSSRARARLVNELENKGLNPEFRISTMTGRIQLHYHGIPVLSGRVREDADGVSDVWALKLAGPSGVFVCHTGGQSRDFGVQVGPRRVIVDDTQGDKTVRLLDGVDVFGFYSLVVPEPQSIARIHSVPPGIGTLGRSTERPGA